MYTLEDLNVWKFLREFRKGKNLSHEGTKTPGNFETNTYWLASLWFYLFLFIKL